MLLFAIQRHLELQLFLIDSHVYSDCATESVRFARSCPITYSFKTFKISWGFGTSVNSRTASS